MKTKNVPKYLLKAIDTLNEVKNCRDAFDLDINIDKQIKAIEIAQDELTKTKKLEKKLEKAKDKIDDLKEELQSYKNADTLVQPETEEDLNADLDDEDEEEEEEDER